MNTTPLRLNNSFGLLGLLIIGLSILIEPKGLIYGPQCIREIMETGFQNRAINLCVGYGLFQLLGASIVGVGIFKIFNANTRLNPLMIITWGYVAMAIILQLPIYWEHSDIVGTFHKHSFWDGGLHFH